MRVIALEEAYTTPLAASLAPPMTPARKGQLEDTQARLKHNVPEALLDLGASRIKAMDEWGVDFQVLSLTSPGPQAWARETAIRAARDANDRAHQAVKAHPERFAAFAMLPTADVPEAVKELEARVKAGFKGAMINGHTRGEFMDARKYWPLFEAAQALDVPIYIHPNFPPEAVMKAYFQGYEELARAPWGFAIDTGLHFLRLVFAGVFDQFPKLKIILGHLGEGIPFHMDRINHHTWPTTKRRGLKRTPSEYILEHMIVTTSGNWSIPALLCTVQTLGVDNVLFSIDWPYESNEDGMNYLKKIPLSPGDVEKIAHGNAERVLKL
jgi:predicted TIM-barrel fold metal-dependent hydrolase